MGQMGNSPTQVHQSTNASRKRYSEEYARCSTMSTSAFSSNSQDWSDSETVSRCSSAPMERCHLPVPGSRQRVNSSPRSPHSKAITRAYKDAKSRRGTGKAGLPSGWKQSATKSGRPYYYHSSDPKNSVTWDKPQPQATSERPYKQSRETMWAVSVNPPRESTESELSKALRSGAWNLCPSPVSDRISGEPHVRDPYISPSFLGAGSDRFMPFKDLKLLLGCMEAQVETTVDENLRLQQLVSTMTPVPSPYWRSPQRSLIVGENALFFRGPSSLKNLFSNPGPTDESSGVWDEPECVRDTESTLTSELLDFDCTSLKK